MRITHVISYFQPQLGYQEFYLAKEQRKMGHEVTILTSNRYYPLAGQWSTTRDRIRSAGVFVEEGLTVYRVPCFELGTYCMSNQIGGLLGDIKPEVVQAHEIWTVIPALAAFFKKSIGYRYVVDTHAFSPLYVSTKGKFLYLLIKRFILDHAVKKADAIVAVGESPRRFLSDEFHIPLTNISVIPLGADIEMFQPSLKDRFLARRKLGFEADDVVITYVGKILPTKDLHILLKAAAPLMRESRNVKILLVGAGTSEYISTLKEISKKHDIERSVVFNGFVPKRELQGIYNASDIGVWLAPSIATTEAMAAGLPLILTRNYPSDDYPYAFNADYYLEYHNGLSFHRGSVSELTNCLRKLVTDSPLRKEMGKRSRKLAEDKFNWRVIANRFLETYISV